MKKNRIGLILISILLVTCVALIATACDDGNNKPTTYELSFVAEGETIPSIVSEAGKTITPPTAPEKEDMIFVGWFLNNEGESVELPTIMPAENRVYYARYEAIDDEEETPTIPDDYTLKLKQVGEDNYLYLDGATAYLDYNNTVIKSELSANGLYVDFSVDKTDYCAVLDGTKAEFDVYAYGYSKNAYLLYLPLDDTFNTERCLIFGDDSTFRIYGDYYENDWALGTYTTVNPATEEYSLKVTKNYTYGLFGDCQVRLTKRVRQSDDTGARPLIYNAFNIYDSTLHASFTSPDNETLVLDGYGYATYTDANGNSVKGVCEDTEVIGFADRFISFIDTDTKESVLYLISGSAFMSIGNEIGLYRVYDVVEMIAGSYYFLLNGLGGVSVYYGESVAYNPTTEVASGTYEVLENGEIRYLFSALVGDATIDDIYKDAFNFKLTTYGSGIYVTPAFAIYNPEIAGTWAAENGASTIELDGYGNATHNDRGSVFSGAMQMYKDLLLITDANDNQRIFRFDDSNAQITYRQIGLEIGNYDLYSYANGFDGTVYIYFDGENRVDYYVYDSVSDDYKVQFSGTYQATENEDEYEIDLGAGNRFKIAVRQLNFGSLYEPAWYTIFIIYDETFAGTYTADNGATLELDGYGFNAVFTDNDGFVFDGEFAKEWNLVTLLYYDEDGEATVFTFRLTGNTFVLKNNEAGVYYNYLLNSDIATDKTRLILGGDGTAYYSHYDDSPNNAIGQEATYTFTHDVLLDADIYTLTFNDNGSTLTFVIDDYSGIPVFIEYDENWAGEFTDDNGYKLVLDGYGRAIYRNDYSEIVLCTVFGENYDAVTFVWDGTKRTFTLDRANNTFASTDKPIGIYYPYQDGTISGRTRMIICADDKIEIQVFSEDSMTYVTANLGTYVKDGKTYMFTSTNGGENFSFKLTEVGGYDVYRVYDGYDTTPLIGEMILDDKTVKNTKLTFDGYGSVTYDFFYEDDGMPRQRTGYYYYSEVYDCMIFVATNENGTEYWLYYIAVDWENHTFEIIDESTPY